MYSTADMPIALQDKIDRELEQGEQIRWMGMPAPNFFTKKSIATLLFGIPWTAFSVYWMLDTTGVSAEVGGEHGFFYLFGLPFVLIGVGMLLSPILCRQAALKTAYVVTDRRAIIIGGLLSLRIRSYGPRDFYNVYRREKSDGSGDVIFAYKTSYDSDGDRRTEEIGFMRIDGVQEVERMIKELVVD